MRASDTDKLSDLPAQSGEMIFDGVFAKFEFLDMNRDDSPREQRVTDSSTLPVQVFSPHHLKPHKE
jgi:hypothetical protein